MTDIFKAFLGKIVRIVPDYKTPFIVFGILDDVLGEGLIVKPFDLGPNGEQMALKGVTLCVDGTTFVPTCEFTMITELDTKYLEPFNENKAAMNRVQNAGR